MVFLLLNLEICVADGAGMELNIADVADAGEVHNHTLKAEAEACVAAGAIAAQIQRPPVILFVETQLCHTGGEHLEALFALAAADDLAYAGNEAVGSGNGLAVIVEAHIEGLDLLGIIGDENGALENLFGEIALMLGLKVDAPLNGEVELMTAIFQHLNGFGVAYGMRLPF